MKACPNPLGPDWILLVEQVGPELANLIFVSNGYRVPKVVPISEIKKAINFKEFTENFAGLANKITRYNQANGTSHTFTKKLAYGNTFKLELHLNYLPVNVEKQRQKMEGKNPVLRVENLTEHKKGFTELYTPSPSERAAGRFNAEGDFVANDNYIDDSDELMDTAAKQVEAVEMQRKKKIDKEIIKVQDSIKQTEDAIKIRDLYGRLKKLKESQEKGEQRILVAEQVDNFEQVLSFADSQLKEVDQILNKEDITFEDIAYARRTIDLWKVAGDFSTAPNMHIILDEAEFNTKEIRKEFKNRQEEAEALSSILGQIEEDYVMQFVREHTAESLTKEEIFKLLKDANKISTITRNIGRHDDAMLHAIFSSVEKANIKAQLEVNEIWEDLDNLGDKVRAKLGNNYNIYKQLTEDGRSTGRMVSRFSAEFYEIRNDLINKAFNKIDTNGQKKKDKKGVEDYFNWVKSNTINFDPRMLIPDSKDAGELTPDEYIYNRVQFSEAEKAKHIAELKAQLGEKGFEYYMARFQKKIDKFKVVRESSYFSIQAEAGLSEAGKANLFEEWLKENSPYWGMDMIDNPASRNKGKDSYYSPTGNIEYGIQVPLRSIKGTPTKWYDVNFDKIENDSDLLEFHTLIMKTLNQMKVLLPPSQQKLMGVGVVPSVSKNIVDIFASKGLAMGIAPFLDKLTQLQTTTDLSTVITADVNPATGAVKKQLQTQFVEDTGSKVNELVTTMRIKYEQETGKIPGAAEMTEFRREARSIIANQKSWDLVKIMKAYSLTTLAYKHKSFIEPQIQMVERLFKDRAEIITNEAGMSKTKDDKIATEKGLANYISALDFFLDSTYYGKGGRKIEGVTKKKLYTTEEKARKKELETLIENESDEKKKATLEEQLKTLGGYRTVSGTFDAVLKFMTFKGLGWNIPSAFSNMGFGGISNIIQASDGREYSMEDLRKAYLLVSNSVGRNLSFNTLFNSTNGNAVKIRSLMDNYDLLKTSNTELYETSQKSTLSKFKKFGPYTLQERSEYVNYAPVMIAMMMSKKEDNSPQFPAIDPEGNTVNYWEALDSAGKLKEGYTTTVDEIKLIQKIRRVIEMNHGDYNNALQVKATVLGRAASQFRTWMFEGFTNRFENEKPDYALSYGLDEPYIRKGRYRSYSAGQLTTALATVGTVFLPGIGTAAGAGAGYLAGKFFNMQGSENSVSDILFTVKQLARKLMRQKTQFGDRFSATDAANMRKNMTELYVLLGLAGLAVLLKGFIDDDDDDESQFIAKFMFNQVTRLQTDITFYTNPMEAEKLTKTALPLAQLIGDVGTIFSDLKGYLDDDQEDDVFESGPFKGDSKFWVHLGEAFPGTSQYIKLHRTGSRIIE